MADCSQDILAAASLIVELGQRDGIGVSPKALQKLLYLVNGWCMEENGYALFNDDFQAWSQGPVIPPLWQQYRGRSTPIKEVEGGDSSRLSEDARIVIGQVWNCYKTRSVDELEEITHDDAWMQTRGELHPRAASKKVISEKAIKASFKNSLERSRESWQDAIDSLAF